MKQSSLVVIILIGFMIIGWFTVLSENQNGAKSEYREHIETAKDYVQRGLYQKAIYEYDDALIIKSSEEIWTEKLSAYEKLYSENPKIYYTYLDDVQKAVENYTDNIDYLLLLSNLYLFQNEYESAYKVLNNAVQQGLQNEEINNQLLKIKYAYETDINVYDSYRACTNGYYAVSESESWSYIKEDGSSTDYTGLVMAGGIGETGIRVIQNQERSILTDNDEVVQGILDFFPEDAGIYSEGLVPIMRDGNYGYYNLLGEFQFGNYKQAGAYVNGEAAVQDQNDQWIIIDNEGNQVSNNKYEDIVLNTNGSHISNEVMIAKQAGKYKIFKEESVVGEYDDADIITDDNMIAVCINGKWGYVNNEGKELIEPTYISAKSFSNGLAAVSNGEHWGFIDPKGNLVIDYVFSDADYFNSNKCCMVQTEKDKSWQLISLCIK